MKETLEKLFEFNRYLLGEGYDNALEYIRFLLKDLETIEVASGTKFGTWEVPEEWVVREAWVKLNGEKIMDWQTNPLSLMMGSYPVHEVMSREQFKKHLHTAEETPAATPFRFKFYGFDQDHLMDEWGICLPYNQVYEQNIEPMAGVKTEDGEEFVPKLKDKLPEGDYEVYIDTTFKPGTLKLGVHTIKGKSDREILLFAHLDHPHQANDNLSGVVCLLDLVHKLKCDHTIKIVFCPETIGSVVYTHTQDLSRVDFVVAVDICGNTNSLLLQKSFNPEDRLNRVAHLALVALLQDHRKGIFRSTIGSDEYAFNDPLIGIPGIMLSTWPYREYHTSEDTPDKIDYEMIEKTGKFILKIIEIYEKDFVPVRNFVGPLRRSLYGAQSASKQTNMSWDYVIYNMDGKRSLAELCCEYGLNFDHAYDVVTKLEQDGYISRADFGKTGQLKAPGKKHSRLSRKAHVPGKRRKVPKTV